MKKENKKNILDIFVDGASRGNPGKAGIGINFKKNNISVLSKAFYIGESTNNFAEYFSFITSLFYLENFFEENLEINLFSDSLLLIKQLKGEFKVKNINLKRCYNYLCEKIKDLNINFFHIRREKNKTADSLANKGIDEKILLPKNINLVLLELQS